MTTTDSPAAARRRLRLALRNAREERKLTQADVAAGLEWSVSKVNRIEGGEVTISPTDLRALVALLGITDGAIVEELTEDARAARRRGWWDVPEYRAHLTPALRQLIQYEAEATTIRNFQPTLFPGVLQNTEYTRAILSFWSELPEESRAARQEIRAERRRRLFDRTDRPEYLLLLDESVVQRPIGGPSVMAKQLQSVLHFIATGDLIARIVPLLFGATLSAAGGFTIVDLHGDESAILYREIGLDDDLVRDERDTVEHYRRAFERMWNVAMSPDDSNALIQRTVEAMTSSIVPNQPTG